MSYNIARTVALSFDAAVAKVTAELKAEGFGIISEIDVQETLRKKLNVAFGKYRILGACNPHFAHQALQMEDRLGVLLPCNVIVRETPTGQIEVAAVNPLETMKAVQNPTLAGLAQEVQASLKRVIERL